MERPTHSGLWWFTGTFQGHPFDGPVLYGRGDLYPLEIMASDEIFPLENFVGEYLPLSRDIVERGQGQETEE